MRRLEPIADRRDQRRVQHAQMRLGCRPHRLGEGISLIRTAAKLVELELQQLQAAAHVRRGTKGDDLQPIVAEHTDMELAHGLVVLEDDGVGGKAGANLVNGERRAALQHRELFVGAPNLVERPDELLLDRPRACRQRVHAAGEGPVGLELLLFDLARVPDQFLPQAPQLVTRGARHPRSEVDRAKGDEVRQAA